MTPDLRERGVPDGGANYINVPMLAWLHDLYPDEVLNYDYGSLKLTPFLVSYYIAYQFVIWSRLRSEINAWDWVAKAQHWYGIGGTTDGAGGSPVTIPSSFYLSSKSAFFGTNPWPWAYPTTDTTYSLPAKYCFEHKKMPTCLQ